MFYNQSNIWILWLKLISNYDLKYPIIWLRKSLKQKDHVSRLRILLWIWRMIFRFHSTKGQHQKRAIKIITIEKYWIIQETLLYSVYTKSGVELLVSCLNPNSKSSNKFKAYTTAERIVTTSGANSQISWGATFFYLGKNFFLRRHAKRPVSAPPILKSIHVLKGTKAWYACTYWTLNQ